MTAAVAVVEITSSVPVCGRSLRGRVLAVRKLVPSTFTGGTVAYVALPPDMSGGIPGGTYPMTDWEWVRVA